MVVIYDRGGHAARAYERRGHTFSVAAQDTGLLVDERGRPWQVAEEALIDEAGTELARLPGHMAYWFGWFSFHPRTEVYGVAAEKEAD